MLVAFLCGTAIVQACVLDALLGLTSASLNRNAFELDVEDVTHYAVFPEAAVSMPIFANSVSALWF